MKKIIVILLFSLSFPLFSQEKISVLILQNEYAHDVHVITDVFEEVLDNTGNYSIDKFFVQEKEDWDKFNYNFKDYQLIISSRLGVDMPEKLRNEFVFHIENGGNLVITHQGVSSFYDWPKFHEVIGLGWYGSSAGEHIFWDESIGDFVRTPLYHGVGVGHGKQHEFLVTMRDTEHPISKGIPVEWVQSKDELYHGLRGPAKNLTIIATAYSDKKTWGSGDHEPIAWTTNYGKGRVFVTVLGHVMKEEFTNAINGINSTENKSEAIYSVGFQTLLARGAEWAATGKVTTKIPDDFPSKTESSYLVPSKVKWKK
ncbi:ThuA domain-containing protein [Colwelliaceae bacterium 6471]